MPAAAGIPPCPPRPAGPSATSTSTSAKAPRAAGRPGRAHRAGVRLHPPHHRDQAVHGPRRPGHGPSRVQQRAPRLRHRGQRPGPPRPGRHQPLGKAHPNAIMIHTPLHASWLNQTGDLLLRHPEESRTPNDFDSLEQLSAPAGFVDRYNQTARPFSWKFPQRPARPHGTVQLPRTARRPSSG